MGSDWDLSIGRDGVPSYLPDDWRFASSLRRVALERADFLRRRYESGDQWSGLEAFLLLASLREWERRTSECITEDMPVKFPSLPTSWTDESVAAARGMWRSVFVARSASEKIRKPRSAEDIADGLQQLLTSLFIAQKSAKAMSNE